MARYSKFIVALIMAAAEWYRVSQGIDLGMDETTVTAIVGLLTAGLVYLIPNRP